jgi:hypothetical protein
MISTKITQAEGKERLKIIRACTVGMLRFSETVISGSYAIALLRTRNLKESLIAVQAELRKRGYE